MKISTMIVLAGIAAASAILAAANFKLKKEYDRKEIREYLSYTQLPAFHHIKDDYTAKQGYEWYLCNIRSSAGFGVGIRFNSGNLLSFSVRNDTLFISKPADASVNDIVFGLPVTINCNQLRSTTSGVANMHLSACAGDSLFVSAARKSNVELSHLKTTYLEVTAGNTATVVISETDSVQHAAVRLRNNSCFAVNNTVITTRQLDISDSASLRLSGRSIENFSIARH